MSSPWKGDQPEAIASKVLKRAEVSKVDFPLIPCHKARADQVQMARKLQNRLALAQYKTIRGWEDLTFDAIAPRVDDELRRKRPASSGDILSDTSSSSASDPSYTNGRTLLSSPLKATVFSDQINSGGSSGHRKRTYNHSFQHPSSSSSTGSRKRHRSSPTACRLLDTSHTTWRNHHQLTQSSPIKPRKTHFTTSQGPNLSFYRGSSHMPDGLQSPDLPTTSDEDENTMPTHSFDIRSSPPRTPPPTRPTDGSGRRPKDKDRSGGEEGADLLLYLATSPSPARPLGKNRLQTPSTPPPRSMALPSSMMNTPGGNNGLLSVFGAPNTPSQGFDFSDYVNITPSPAQSAWPKTPRTLKTPLTAARRRLTFENFTSSPHV